MAFTPLPSEDVARLVADSNDERYLFSSDDPHIEGGRDPVGTFERSVATLDGGAQTKFFSENFLRLWPAARVDELQAASGQISLVRAVSRNRPISSPMLASTAIPRSVSSSNADCRSVNDQLTIRVGSVVLTVTGVVNSAP